jgi:prevent-host-death family protein
MRHGSARDAKNHFGELIDMARATPVAIEKHGRAVVIVLAYERLVAADRASVKRSARGSISKRES